jgi:hypothetical protein
MSNGVFTPLGGGSQQPFNYGLQPGQSPVSQSTINTNLANLAANNNGPMSAFGNFWNNNGQGIMQGLGAVTGLANLYAGFRALGMQEDQFDFQKEAWNKNYNNQVKDYENRLRDRWAAVRNAREARGKSYQSLDAYLGERSLTGSAPAPRNSGGGGNAGSAGNTNNRGG